MRTLQLSENDNSDSSEETPPADIVLEDTSENGNETPPTRVENLPQMPPPTKPPLRKNRKRTNNERLDEAHIYVTSIGIGGIIGSAKRRK